MQVESVKYVDFSKVFKNTPLARHAFDSWDNLDFSFGDSSYTMISKEKMLDILTDIQYDSDKQKECDELDAVKVRIQSLSDDVFINLEG